MEILQALASLPLKENTFLGEEKMKLPYYHSEYNEKKQNNDEQPAECLNIRIYGGCILGFSLNHVFCRGVHDIRLVHVTFIPLVHVTLNTNFQDVHTQVNISTIERKLYTRAIHTEN